MSLDLNVKVDATTTGYEAALGRAQNATLRYDASLKNLESDMMKLQKQLDDDIAAALKRQHDAMTKAGQGMFVFGAAVAAGLGLAVNEAVKWESAWTGVTKTVNGSAAQMAELEAGLRQLATTLPATHEEIAAVAEAAGQLGIQRDAILGFTKTMIDLSETTNLTADQAATDMARFANIMQTPQDEIDRLGASLVALGNAGASTEAEILSMATRIAGAGAQLGLSEGEVMGLANALSSVGIEAEAGGSAISMVMKNIQVQASDGAGALEDFAHVAGMSNKEFFDLWKSDPAAGLNAFVQGLGRLKATGGDAIATLQDMEITQIRQSDALLRLAGSGDLLTESLELGNQAWDENSALLAEAEKRYETTEAKVQIARNTLRDSAIDVGSILLPALASLADLVADLGATWRDLPGPVKTAGVVLGIAAAAIGLFGGAALIAIPKIAAFKAAVAGLEAGALKTVGTRIGALTSALGGPWGIAIGAGITAMTLFAAKHGDAAREIDEVRQTLDQQTGALTENTREWAKKQLLESGALRAAQELGLNLADVTDAATGQADALERVNTVLLSISGSGHGFSDFNVLGTDKIFSSDQAKAATTVMDALGHTQGVLQDATANQNLLAAAGENAADGTAAAGDAQKGTTAAWEDGADAAGELSDEIKTLQDLFDDLSGSFLNQREAGRQVRDSLRDIREGVAKYKEEHEGLKGAFKRGTDSGDEFAGMLDNLATDYQNQIDATAQLSGSEKRTMEVYRASKARLIEVADQLGMTKDQAKAYAEQVLGTPEMIRTFFNAETEQAEVDVRRFRGLLDGLDGDTAQTFIRVTTLRNDIGESGDPRFPSSKPAPSAPSSSPGRFQEANGGIRQAFAGGGFSFGGGYVERVPQLRQGGGTVVWNEPETGWEAYISGKPGMDARNREVWLEAGRRLGTLGGASYAQASHGGRSFDTGGGGTRVVERIVERLPSHLTLSVDGQQFDAYVDDRADGRYAANAEHDHVVGRR